MVGVASRRAEVTVAAKNAFSLRINPAWALAVGTIATVIFAVLTAVFPSYVAVVGNYCGPANGLGFQLAPVNRLDALCMEYDVCVMATLVAKKSTAQSL